MHSERFRWEAGTRLFDQGRAVAADEAGALGALRQAIRAGGEFLVGPGGVERLEQGTSGFLRTRSSGTTGTAKTIRRSHRSWIASFEVSRDHLGIGAADVYGVLGDLAHSLTLYALVEGAHLGATLHGLAGLRPGRQARLLEEAGVTVLYCTPTQLRLICEADRPLPRLRHILCGGGRLPPGLRARVQALTPTATLREFYGAAETSFVAWGAAEGPEGSVGRAYPGVEIRIGPPDGPPAGPEGEIWVRSPYLFEGYAEGDSAETRWCDGFLSVGEIGRLAADGGLSIVGRRNRMVTIADQNVFPEALEAFLLADPAVTHCAVMPQRDPRRGTVLVAVIAGTGDAATAERLRRACQAAFGPLAAPRRMIFWSDFPLTLSGKPDLGAIARHLDGAA